jgi:hypothetical protein
MFEKSQQETKNWVSKAIDFYKASGKDIAFAEFTNPKGPFVQNEMYIFVLDTKGIMLAHGVNEKYIGKNFSDVKDSTGKSFAREIINVANVSGNGWIDYHWFNPVTKEMKPKSVYFEKVDDLIFCSGIYIEKPVDFIAVSVPGNWTG